MKTTLTKAGYIKLLADWIEQRSGIQQEHFFSYGRAESQEKFEEAQKEIYRQKKDAHILLDFIAQDESITADHIKAEFSNGMLTIVPPSNELHLWDHGYRPVTYRKLVCKKVVNLIVDRIKEKRIKENSDRPVLEVLCEQVGNQIANRYY